MKQIYLKFSMLLLCLVVGLSAWGEESVVYTLDATNTNNKGSNQNYASDCDISVNDITWNITGNATMNPWRIGGKSLTEVDRAVYTRTAYSSVLTKITLEIGGASSVTINSIKLIHSTNADFSNETTINASGTSASTTYTFEPDGGFPANSYFKFVFNVTISSTTNKFIEFKNVKFYGEKGTDIDLPQTYSVIIDDKISNGIVTPSHTSATEGTEVTLSATPNDGYEFTSWTVLDGDANEITVNDNKFTMPASNVEVSATFNQIQLGDSPIEIIPNNTFWGSTETGQITGVKYLEGKTQGITININRGESTVAMYFNGSQTRAYDKYIMAFSVPSGYNITAIQFTADGNNWAGTHTASVGTMTDNKNWTGSSPEVTITFGGTCRITKIIVTYVAAKTLQSIVVSGTPTKTTYQAGETLDPTGLTVTGTYDDGSNSAITSGITWAFDPATLSVGQTNCNVTATVGEISSEAYTITGLTVTEPVTLSSISVSGTPSEFWKGDTFNHNGMTVTATYSDESTADVTNAVSFSEPDMTAIGEQTVTVTYQGKEATYTINVQTIANTKETAYTVTEAKALIDAGKDLTTEVYVKGTVSDVDNYNSTYKSITYWLDEKTFEVYSGKGLGNTDFNSIDDIEVGAEVIIYGIIKKYKDTYEFDKENYLVSYVAPVHETYTITLNSCGNTINGESAIEVEEGKSVNLPQASTTATGFVFKGWSTTEQKDETNTLPTLVNNSYSPTADITLYPIFEKSETTGDTDVEIAWVIKDVSELEDNSLYVMVVTNGTNSKIVSAEKSSEDYLTGRDVTIENGIITSNVPNGYPWIFNCYGENDKTYGFTGNNTGYLYNLGVSYSNYQRWGLVSNGDKTYSMESRGNSPYNHSGTYIYLDNNTIRTTSTPSESKVQFYAQDYIEVGGTTTYTYTSYPAGEMLTITLNPACHDEDGKVYSTFSSSKAFVVPENLIVSEIAIIDGKFYVESYKTNDVVPANTGVMVSAEEGGNYLVEVAGAELSELAESVLGEENSLRPSGDNGIQSTEMSALSEGCYFYRLTMKGEQIGYYWGAPEGVAFTLAPNKAYMVIEKTAEIKSGAWINGLSTSISNPYIIADNNVIYNLNGQRISSVTKGLYIKDGKKYFVK